MRTPAPVLLATVLLAAPAALSAQRALTPDALERHAAALDDSAFARYRELLTFPNDANRPEDILTLSVWLEAQLARRGFTTERLEMPGSDAILATRPAARATRTVLVYLQADGQPVDPARWHQESPWSPTLKTRRAGATGVDGNPREWETLAWERLYEDPDPEWRMFARSAADSKGPVAQFLAALDVLSAAGVRPSYHLKVIIDTEEELGSPHLAAAVERYRDRLAADMLLIFDGPPHSSGQPTLVFGARGIADITLTAYGPLGAQHSGHWGNYVPNPALRLAQVLASMKDERGRVTIPGFYDGVALDDATRAILGAVPDDIPAIHRRLGIAAPDGVAATPEEAVQYPSLNVRGLQAGWVGNEARTIIPPVAIAELDLRLVPESDDARLLGLVRDHVTRQGYHVVSGRDPTPEERAQHPKLMRFDAHTSYGAFRTPFDAPPGVWTARAYRRLFGELPIRIRMAGGSVPISPFVSTLKIPAVIVPTVNPDNNQHSPNENLRVLDFRRGIRIIAAVLAEPLP